MLSDLLRMKDLIQAGLQEFEISGISIFWTFFTFTWSVIISTD